MSVFIGPNERPLVDREDRMLAPAFPHVGQALLAVPEHEAELVVEVAELGHLPQVVLAETAILPGLDHDRRDLADGDGRRRGRPVGQLPQRKFPPVAELGKELLEAIDHEVRGRGAGPA
jgi:hypothetical protein